MKSIGIAVPAFLLMLAAGCVSTGSEPHDTIVTADTRVKSSPVAADPAPRAAGAQTEGSADNAAATEVGTFMKNAEDAIAAGRYSEGIRNYVSALASAKHSGTGNRDIERMADKAEAELKKIGNALSLQPQAAWVDEAGVQVPASSIKADKGSLLAPAVVLTLTLGTGKYTIADAPVRFSFVKGGGRIVESVTTDEYGLANSSVLSFANPSDENVVRASVSFGIPGFTYEFDKTFRDFVYMPPARTATIICAEKSEFGMASNPLILDETYLAMKNLRMDFSPFNAVLIGNEFDSLYNGDQAAIEKIGKASKVTYLVVVLVDCYDVRRMVVNGKEYDLFSSFASVNLRIIRAEDKRIVFSLPVEKIRGQGNSKETAVQDVYKKARAEFSGRLKAEMKNIEKVIAGGE